MRKAYDTFLLSEVSAELAAKAGGFEPYRYECSHCGEEVRLAAVGSKSMVPHFRHRSGNSDVECEYYLGQYGALSTDARSRKSKNERAEFYFDSYKKLFYLGLSFSDSEIAAYEQLSTIFELRVASQAQPFYTVRINGRNFSSDIQKMIPLERFSNRYFLSNTLNGIKRKYDVFNNVVDDAATFFKIQNVDNGYRAKLVRSSILYTNIPYFVLFSRQSKFWTSENIHMPEGMKVESTFEFETMGRKFVGKKITIISKTAGIDSLLSSWGYQLEASETLTLLWPPTFNTDGVAMIGSEAAYLYATFDLQPHGNINLRPEDIANLGDGISRIAIQTKVKIYKKNAELMLEAYKQDLENYSELPIVRRSYDKFQTSDGSFFMFNRSGVFSLSKGFIVQMTPDCEVRHYCNGYLNEIISPLKPTLITGEALLRDILSYYKRTETLDTDDYKQLDLSQVALRYIETCKKSELINSAVKRLIMEGRI